MCGISGFYTPFVPEVEKKMRGLIEEMCLVIEHRGPDDFGCHINPQYGVGFGHQRLSIIDIESGQQPLSNLNETTWVVFNGEIYNFRSLRKQLKSRGYVFQTQSDTEVIIAAYDTWGDNCVDYFRGMFAFAIWDVNKKRIFCARDRLGIKPFYYFWDGSNFVFASELKSILVHPIVIRELDYAAIGNYLRLQYIPSPQTPFKNIFKLGAGHKLAIEDEKLTIDRYWKINLNANEFDGSRDEAARELRLRLQQSTDMRLMSEVPIGAFLSGGTDSSIIVSLMSQTLGEGVKTHCMGFDKKGFDERTHAKFIADRFNTDHSESLVSFDVGNTLDKMIWHMDEPFADSSAIPTYYLCKKARERVTVCLSGDGGDELFTGYNWYQELAKLKYIDQKMPGLFRSIVSNMPYRESFYTLRGATLLKNLALPMSSRHANLLSYFSDDHISKLVNKDMAMVASAHPIEMLYSEIGESCNDAVKVAQWVDLQSYMSEDILMKVDKMSMAHSLEVRVPLLDHKVVELAFLLRTSAKYDGKTRKKILKECASDLIPAEFFKRRKQGFSVPLRDWLLTDLRGRVEDLLLTPNAQTSQFFDRSEVRKLWRQFSTNRFRIDLGHHIWSLLCFEMWHKQFLLNGRQS